MGHFATFSLRNRAFVGLATVIVAIFGGISLNSLRTELIPDLQFPAVGVVVPYAGASPEAVEQEITVPIEDSLAGVEGLESLNSVSSNGSAVIVVLLEYGTDLDRARQEVETEVTGLRTLPADVDPLVFAGDFDQFPILQLAITSDDKPRVLAQKINDVVLPELSDIEGVRQTELTGAPVQRVEITLQPRAATAGVTGAQVADALNNNASMVPAGTLEQGDTALAVQVGTTPTSIEQLRAVPVPLPRGGTAPLGTLAEVKVSAAAPTSYSRTNGQPSQSVAITKTPDGNTVQISEEVNELIAELEEKLGANATITVTFDQAPFIEKSVEDLTVEGGLGLVFAVIVILIFLASLRSTIVTAISIPLSLLVTLIGLHLGGYTLNILTLGALTVAVGRVVDDSIVVIENIKRHLSYGVEKSAAIITGVKEVAGAITSSTIATAAVFLPIGIVGGQVGELFRPFAITVALALMASLLVALTIIPVLAYWFLRVPADPESPEVVAERAEAAERRMWLRRIYDPALGWVLGRPWVTVAGALAILLVTLALTPLMKTNFLGSTGQNTLTVTQELKAGASLARRDATARQVEEVLSAHDAVETVQTSVGESGLAGLFTGGSNSFALTLEEGSDADAVTDELEEQLAELPGDITVSAGNAGFSTDLELVVTAVDPRDLSAAAEQVVEALQDVDGIGTVTSDAAPAQPILDVQPLPTAASAGLTGPQLGQVLAQVLRQPPLGQVTIAGDRLDVVLAGTPKPRTVEQLARIPVGQGTLGQLATIERKRVAASISRLDGDRTVTITASPAADDLGSVTGEVRSLIDELDLPPGTEVALGGVAEDQAEAFAQLGLALLIAVLIVYLVMVGTFRSLIQPLILMVSVPFAATGAVLLQLVTGIPLGVPSLIGALMLIGVVVTNAIVLIDLVNQYRERGASVLEALTEGGGKRLRPIVMTALATILALTPMALGVTGGSAFISQPLAIVVIGGLLSSTFLTLLLVPVLYLLVERRGERRAAKRESATREAATA